MKGGPMTFQTMKFISVSGLNFYSAHQPLYFPDSSYNQRSHALPNNESSFQLVARTSTQLINPFTFQTPHTIRGSHALPDNESSFQLVA
ncbi:hypothetical protein SUGI_1171510 [Cryptomeria japonica]|nr:hypothetical protein SUGI_1171510 [Cryptomeria japonica]